TRSYTARALFAAPALLPFLAASGCAAAPSALAWLSLLPTEEVTELSALVPEIAVAQQSRDISNDTAERVLTPLSTTLRETARAFLAHNLSIAATATVLEVHRNTLVQRLDRIEHRTGLNLRTFDHAVAMRLTLLAAEALEDPYHGG
ncbi:MAG: PucR family transcriptional regulator, partial [Comamonadaceae bacterium]